MENKGILKNKSVEFAIRIVNLYKHLVEIKKEYILTKVFAFVISLHTYSYEFCLKI